MSPTFSEEGFVSLFDGNDLSGWTQKGGDAIYKVDGDCILGIVNDEKRNSFLCTEKEYENFILKIDFKFDKPFNSGVQFRSNARKDGVREIVFGYQYELESNGMTGAVYDESRRNTWLPVQFTDEERNQRTKDAFKSGEWNSLEIQCIGPSIKTWLNNILILDMMDTLTDRGFIGLQVHAAKGDGQVRWKNIRIKELPSTPWVPFFVKGEFVDLEIKPAGEWKFVDPETVRGFSTKEETRDGMVLSKQSYDNFAARVSFKKTSGNSGLYFRATEVDKPYWLKGFQNEIEGNSAAGGLWEVEGRGWVFKPDEEKNGKIIRPTDWNDISIVAVGDRLVTNLNGVQVVDLIDSECAKEGKTGLQLHGGQGMEYLFRNYEIKPIPKDLLPLLERKK
ncbi:MAG: 3-keto-disaccharide hydrolase [Thermoguttaceae bacterium]